MKTLVITCLVSVLSLSATAQNLLLGAEGQKFYEEYLLKKTLTGETPEYDGTPYLNPEFTDASIIPPGKDIIEKAPLRYNAYKDLFEIEMEDGAYELKPGGDISEVRLDGHLFLFKDYEYLSRDYSGYLELLQEGEYSLFKQHQVEFHDAVPAQAYQDAKPARFSTENPLFYLSHKDSKPVFVRNRKAMLEFAADNEKELKEYLKDSKNRLRNEEDFVQAVNFLNKLL